MKSLKEGISGGPKPAPVQQATKPAPAPPTAQVPAASSADPDAAKRDAYKELPQYIGDVKKLLILASELKLDVSTSKAQINKAVTAGKTRDLDNAIRLVKEGKAGLERDIRATLLQKVRTLETALSLEKKSGREMAAQEHSLKEIKTTMELNDFQNASEEIKKVEAQMLRSSTTQISQVEIETVSCAIGDAESLNLNVSEARGIYQAALSAAESNDAAKSSQLSKQALDALNKILPSYIAGEMRKAKVTLREIKMMNVDITLPVNLLKEANDNVLVGDYCAALGSIRKFREFVDRAQS